jgi:arginine exporter protein ArgO
VGKKEKLNYFRVIVDVFAALLASFTGIALIGYAVFGIQLIPSGSTEFKLAIIFSGCLCIVIAAVAMFDGLKPKKSRRGKP